MIGYKDKRIKGWEKHRQREGYGAMWGQQEVEEKRQGKICLKKNLAPGSDAENGCQLPLNQPKKQKQKRTVHVHGNDSFLALCKPE